MRIPITVVVGLLLLNYPSPGIPRAPGGKPNLTAPAPRVNGKMDLSGMWAADTPRYLANLAGGGSEVSCEPWAEEQYRILNPSWLGYSVRKWNGDQFVVDTAGFNEKFGMDTDGHPHTDACT